MMRRAWLGIWVMASALLAPLAAHAERHGEVSVALRSFVNRDTGERAESKEVAQYRLAVGFYRAGLYQASLAIFSEIDQHPPGFTFAVRGGVR